jgi:hypothetical protein
MSIDRHNPRPLLIVCHLPYPPCFSLQTTFNSEIIIAFYSAFMVCLVETIQQKNCILQVPRSLLIVIYLPLLCSE